MYGGCEADPGRPTAKGIFLGFMEAAEMGAEETAFVGAGGIKLKTEEKTEICSSAHTIWPLICRRVWCAVPGGARGRRCMLIPTPMRFTYPCTPGEH